MGQMPSGVIDNESRFGFIYEGSSRISVLLGQHPRNAKRAQSPQKAAVRAACHGVRGALVSQVRSLE